MIFKVAWFMVGKLSSPVLDGGHVAPCDDPRLRCAWSEGVRLGKKDGPEFVPSTIAVSLGNTKTCDFR